MSIITAQIGIGRWGKNILRNLAGLPECDLRYVCDASPEQIKVQQQNYPDLNYISDPEIIFNDPDVQAVVIASPASTHFELAKKALQSGKHVFAEKPLVLEIAECEELAALAAEKDLVLMEGHLLLYHGAILRLKQAVSEGLIGDIHHLYFRRTNLGAIRFEANVLWDVGPHDFSVLLLLLDGDMPQDVSASGTGCYLPDNEEVVLTAMKFADGRVAHFHESWLDPFKDRKILIIGDKGMLFLDEHATDGKVKLVKKKIVDTGHELEHERFKYQDEGHQVLDYEETEPLKSEMQHFLDCAANNKQPRSNPQNSLRVLKLLKAAQKSLDTGEVVQI
ncbi:Gfo/Idh/MocA family protein [Candidatus Margulisiibacteriota bacterium]